MTSSQTAIFSLLSVLPLVAVTAYLFGRAHQREQCEAMQRHREAEHLARLSADMRDREAWRQALRGINRDEPERVLKVQT